MSEWNAVVKRLVALGWRVDEQGALHSPRDSLVVDREMFEGATRASDTAAMRQHVATMKQYREEGFSPEGGDERLAEFEEVLRLLEGQEPDSG